MSFVLMTVLAAHSALAQTSAVTSSTDIISAIRVEGLQRSSEDSVISYLLVRPGDSFDADRIDRSLKSLFATGRFANVQIRREGNDLVVTVVENPTINRVAFEGNDDLDDDTLKSEVSSRPLGLFSRSTVQSDVRRILSLYRRSGRFGAAVDPKIIELPQNRVDIVFEINEGPVTGVEEIRFVGNKAISDSELRGVIRTKQSRWWRFLSTDDTYDPDRLSADRDLLRRFYLTEGYADFRVVSAVAELSPNRENFFITFTLEEGELYDFGNIDVVSKLNGLSADQVRDVIEIAPGDQYDASKVEKTIDALTDKVGTLGFAFVDITPKLERDRANRRINITFEIAEGRRVFVERINISGNVRTIDKVIRREFRFVEGDAYNTTQLRRSRQRLLDLDYFEKVDVDESPGTAPDRADVNVKVQEKSTGSLSVGAGFATGSGFLGDISVRERNLLGRGQDVRATLLLGQLQQQVDVSFTEPYFLDRDVSAGADLFYTQTDRQSESSFDTKVLGGALRANYPITEHFSQGWRYSLRRSEIDNVPSNASIYVKDAEGSEVISEVSHNLLYDKRDSRINPTSGYFGRFTTDVAGLGGTAAYIRDRIDAGTYYPIAESWIVSLTGSAGHIHGLGESVNLLDRFFIGGAEVRGFPTDGIGPRDTSTDDALGGQLFYAGSVQLTFPLGLPEELGIRGRTFFDVGSSWQLSDNGPTVADSSAPRASVGAGVTWQSPLGPIGVDLGFAILKESYDDTEILRVNFGTRF